MALDDVELARLLVDVDVPRAELVRLVARAHAGQARARRRPARPGRDDVRAQAAARPARSPPTRRTSRTSRRTRRCSPPTPPRRRCAASPRCETTVGVSRYAPLNAMAHPGRLADRAARRDDAVRGRGAPQPAARDPGPRRRTPRRSRCTAPSKAFVDGDDTPWSKAFLASAYASRGVKVRFTSGTGSEALMGHSRGLLDARTSRRAASALVRAAGSQGVQNGAHLLRRAGAEPCPAARARSWPRT